MALNVSSIAKLRCASPPSMQYSMMYPSMPPAPILSGGSHFKAQVPSVMSSTISRVGSLVGAMKE